MNISEKTQYVKIALAVVMMAFLVVASVTLIKNPFGKSDVPSIITVTGKGEIQAVPDVSRFSVSVSEKAGTQSEALAKASEKINIVIAGLKDLGIEDKDIKTENVSTYPDYQYVHATGEQKLVGWVSSHTLSVKVRTLELVPDVQQLFADSKITNVSGPSLSIDDTDALQLNARELAIMDAEEQAEILANQLGIRLGKIVSFSESANGGFSPLGYAREDMIMSVKAQNTSPEISVGEQTITSNVSVTYRIK